VYKNSAENNFCNTKSRQAKIYKSRHYAILDFGGRIEEGLEGGFGGWAILEKFFARNFFEKFLHARRIFFRKNFSTAHFFLQKFSARADFFCKNFCTRGAFFLQNFQHAQIFFARQIFFALFLKNVIIAKSMQTYFQDVMQNFFR